MTFFKVNVFAVAIVAAWICPFGGASDDFAPQTLNHDSFFEDAFLNMTQLLNKYGYPAETHTVVTADGYILTLYRIPFGRKCGPDSRGKVPVLVQHGLMSSSYDYIIMGPEKSLGYILADKCYDVWMGNNRGNSQSRKHVKLSPKKQEFWQFSWHEMGEYDLPAMIDYILETTKQPNLHYVGHSQGTTQFFVFGALHPEYQSKIRSMQALSPVAFMKNMANPIIQIICIFKSSLEAIVNLIGLHEFIPNIKVLNILGSEICKDKYPEFQLLCSNVMFLLGGFDEYQLNKTMLPIIIGHTPAGASSRQIIHYAQGIKSGRFRQYDYGLFNLIRYKSIAPPEYDLAKINIPIALYYGRNDWLASIKDIDSLRKKLPNVIENYPIPFSKFNHLDFIFGTDAYHLVYEKVVEVLNKY